MWITLYRAVSRVLWWGRLSVDLKAVSAAGYLADGVIGGCALYPVTSAGPFCLWLPVVVAPEAAWVSAWGSGAGGYRARC